MVPPRKKSCDLDDHSREISAFFANDKHTEKSCGTATVKKCRDLDEHPWGMFHLNVVLSIEFDQ